MQEAVLIMSMWFSHTHIPMSKHSLWPWQLKVHLHCRSLDFDTKEYKMKEWNIWLLEKKDIKKENKQQQEHK